LPDGATVTGSGTGAVTVTGTLGQINAALTTLDYASNAPGVVPGADTISLKVTDSDGGTDTKTIAVTVEPAVPAAPSLNPPTYTGSATSGHWNLSGIAETGSTVKIYDRTQAGSGNPSGLVATLTDGAANGAWAYLALPSNAADSRNTAHDYYATATDLAGNVSQASGDYWIGTSNNDVFNFSSAYALLNGGAWGDGGTDTIAFNAPVSLTDADFANVHLGGLKLPSGTTGNSTAFAVTLSGASSAMLGADASSAKISTVNTGAAATNLTDSVGGTLAVNAAAMPSTSVLTLSAGSGSETFSVSGLAGTLALQGAGQINVTDAAAGTLNVDATARSSGGALTLSSGAGTEGFRVAGLATNLTATAVKGALTVTTAAGSVSIATGSGADKITAGIGGGNVLTLTGSHAATVSGLTGNLSAGAYSGALTITATGSGPQTIVAGSGADVITAGPGDTITGGAGGDHFEYLTGANSLYSNYDSITDFGVGADKFEIGHTVTGANFHSLTHAATGNLLADLGATLTSANLAATGADLISFTGSGTDAGSFVVINNAGVSGFNAALDAVVKVQTGAAVTASSFIA
jgi:hypothetical protein